MSIETQQKPPWFRFDVTPAEAGTRIDQILCATVPELSRSAAARLLKQGHVSINGETVERTSHRPAAGDRVELMIPPAEPSDVVPQDLPIRIVYEDEDLAIIDKAPGLVVHPAAGHADGTLVNALLHHLDDLSGVGGELRPGIVHRLDKDTSGLLVVAKHDRAHRALSENWHGPDVRKFYLALVYGTPSPLAATIDKPIGRHPRDRKRMGIVPGARPARTSYRVERSFPGCSLVELELHTGRTHQIRVHLQSIGHPVVGDSVYGGAQWKGAPDRRVRDLLRKQPRQALHASRLEIAHPVSGERLSFTAPLPDDMRRLLDALASS